MLLTIYLLIALGVAILAIEFHNETTWFDIVLGVACGLAWPLLAFTTFIQWVIIGLAIRNRK